MATREVLTQTQREYFYELSDQVSERERIRYYTLSEEDIQIIRQQRGATNQLGFAIQLAYLRFPGRPLASGEKIPDFLVSLLAKRLGIVPAAIQNYAKIRDTTRREHISKIFAKLGKVLIEAKEMEQDPFVSLQAVIPWDQFVYSVEQAEALARPAEFDYLELLDTYYGQFRKFAPRLLQIYTFQSSGITQTLCEALEILKELNTSKKEKFLNLLPWIL